MLTLLEPAGGVHDRGGAPGRRGPIAVAGSHRVCGGAAGQVPALRITFAGPSDLGLELRTGLFAAGAAAGAAPGAAPGAAAGAAAGRATVMVVRLIGLPPELDALVQGRPYPELRFPLPVLPGVACTVSAVEVACTRLPRCGRVGDAPDAPAAEVLPATRDRGPVLVVRPFGRDPLRGGLSVHRHTVSLRLRWARG